MRSLGWVILNLAQALWTVLWTAIWAPAALVILVLTCSRKIPLRMAGRIWGAGLIWGGGATLEVTGLERVDFSTPHVFVSNHESMIDIPVMFRALPVSLHYVIKKELKYVPFIGWYAWAMGMVFVDRSAQFGAISSLKGVGRLIREGRSIMAFPEGTRTRGGAVLPFKKGVFAAAIEAGAPVVPVAIAGAEAVLPADCFRVRPGVIKVAVGRPIPTTELTAKDRASLAERARAEVVKLHDSIR